MVGIVTYEKVREKFEEKGYNLYNFWITFPPIFDPTYYILLNYTKLEAYEQFKKDNKKYFDEYQKQLEYLSTWIDYQQYKF